MQYIDLRSDTVTKPTAGMLRAMHSAAVGDDVFEEDPTTIALEEKCAEMFGKEAGLFCPSGTMTNQIAIKISTAAPGEVICDKTAHIYNYEGGGISFNSGCSVRLLDGKLGIFTADQAEAAINPDNVHYPPTQMIAVENTANRGGGAIWPMSNLRRLSELCKKHRLKFHLDGARIFNALAATGESTQSHGELFDTISICLSKGLGAPVGSVLLGNAAGIKHGRRMRKILGGGMRQTGYLAAAGIYALDHHVARLEEDHQRASVLGRAVEDLPYVHEVLPVVTNIVVFRLKAGYEVEKVINLLKENGVLAVPFGVGSIRLVTHLDVDDQQIAVVVEVLKLLGSKLT